MSRPKVPIVVWDAKTGDKEFLEMNRCQRTLAIVLGLCFALGASALDIDAALTPAARAKLDKGEAVVIKNKIDDSGKSVISNSAAMIVVDKPVEDVWATVIDFEKLPEFIPRLISSEKYEEKDGKIGIKQSVKVLWKKINYHVLQSEDAEHHIMTFELDKSQKNDISETNGRWELREYGEGKCLAFYFLALDSGMPVPRFIQNMLLNQDLPATMYGLKKRVESGGTYKKN